MKKFNLALIGCGPHAHRVYLKHIEKYRGSEHIHPALLVDLKSQREKVLSYLKDVNYKFGKIVFLDDEELNSEKFSKVTESILNELEKELELDGIIISTEPKAHKKYCIWALKNNISILVDKPLTSPLLSSTSETGALKIRKDYLEILKAKKRSKGKVIVQCQRRYHYGYLFLMNYLQKFINKYRVPITYIDIFHGDGCWVFPNEFYERENHPYKYGYGKLMHSGYHFVDLLAWLINLNKSLVNYDKVEILAKPLKPSDLNAQLDQNFLIKTFGENSRKSIYKKYNLSELDSFGEVDCYSKLFLYNKEKLITSCNLDLLQNSFSRRAWKRLPKDTYKGNGRVRHERVNIEIGPLLNIQIHSYQAYEPRHKEDIKGFGNEDHFEIFIYRNKSLVGGKSFVRLDFGEADRARNINDKYYLGHNERARDIAFLDFLHKDDSGASLEEQDLTIKLLMEIESSLSKNYNHKNPLISRPFSLKNHVS